MADAEQLRREVVATYKLDEATGYFDDNFDVDLPCCARYLRARGGDSAKAKAMLVSTLEWRRKLKVGTLVEDSFETIKLEACGKTFVMPSPHLDVDGRTVVVMRNRLENTMSHDGNVTHLIYQMERAVKAARATQHEKWVLLIDFEGYSMRNAPPMKTSKATLGLMQHHYPERLHRAVLVDAPWLFNAAFKVISPFIDAVTKEKLVFVRGDAAAKRAKVAALVPLENVEACMGGNSTYSYDAQAYLAEDAAKFEAAAKVRG
ncbi:CRAL-TRIO domain-containing protein [Pelagophyceae sp. CCMP2097]|nr:CRAL-TRIO domain-containing protein [Pelagophyceae sp. CCMP2097]|mmetsp:Transcript_10791/g.35939  ORF Transcript_10791/g.35939 Transcript_10791/m.35939 type:complete len:261 (-) Transcript_10791:40-822(-)